MKKFKDNAGREWTVTVNVSSVRRVRDTVKVDILEVVEGDLIKRLITDPVLLCDVIFAICQPDAEAAHVTSEQFGQAMCGDPIDDATRALLDEIADFSPSPRDRANLHKVIEMTWQGMEKVRDLIDVRISSGELDRIVDQVLANVGRPSGSAPASSESTPAP